MFLNKCHCILWNYIYTSVSWASSTCVLFISLMQLINGAQCLNITFLFLLFEAAAVLVFRIVIVPLKCMYGLL